MNSIAQFWRDPTMPYAESRRACHSRTCYKPHSHPTYSIGAVDEGTSLFTGASDGPITLHAGSVVFVPASRIHACNPVPNTAWSYQMLHLSAAWFHAARQEYDQTQVNHVSIAPIRVVVNPRVYARFCRLNTVLFFQVDPRDKEATLIEFMGDFDEAQGLPINVPVISPHLIGQLTPILDFLRHGPATGTPLAELACLADMSRYQLIRAFRATTGMTPHAWQLNQRINLARGRIRAGEGIADVAYRLGFADQAHFQRVFKAYAGVTPGRFRT